MSRRPAADRRSLRPARTLPALVLALAALVLTTARPPAQPPAPGQLAYVLADREAVQALLQRAELALLEDRPAEALEPLLLILLRAEDDVAPAGRELHIGLRERARSLVVALPPALVAAARAARTAEAEALLGRGLATSDETTLWRCVEQFTLTPPAAAALEILGDRALEQGDAGKAYRVFRRYRRYYRPPEVFADLPWPRILAKAGASAAAVGDDEQLAELRRTAAGQADIEVPIGGRTVRLGDYLQALAPAPPPAPPAGWPTFGGSTTRSAVPSRPEEHYTCRWIAIDRPQLGQLGDDMDRLGEAPPGLRSYTCIQPPLPAVEEDRLIHYFNGRALVQLDLTTGKPRGEHAFRDTNPADRATLPYRFRHVTLGPEGVFLLTECDPELTNLPTQRVLHCFATPPGGGPPVERWSRGGPDDPDPVLAAADLTGSPLRVGDRVYIGGTVRRTDDRVYVFAFEPETGRLAWKRFLCAGAGAQDGAHFPRVIGGDDEIDPTHGEVMASAWRGVVYVATNMGVVAAFARGDGEILWLHRYPRRSRPQHPSLWPAVTPLPWLDNPLPIAGGRLLVTPRDSDHLHVLAGEPDFAQGLVELAAVRKTAVDAEFLYLVGTTADRAYLAERRWVGQQQIFRIVCLNLAAAPVSEQWTFEIPHVPAAPRDEPHEYFTGRALLAREVVLVPTNKHLHALDAGTGALRFSVAPDPTMKSLGVEEFGNVIPAGRGFLTVGPDSVCGWEPGAPAGGD
ncbi:MAG: PQQ-like beta-propeller repeat protein [Planctomycetes bacterium]|nr:PQQ-like beta-propeller repeat protein [Planctomycetota bacterium]